MKKREMRPKQVRVWFSRDEHQSIMAEAQATNARSLDEYIHGLTVRRPSLRRCDTAQVKHRQNELLAAILQSLTTFREEHREALGLTELVWFDCLLLGWFSQMSALCAAGESKKEPPGQLNR